MEAVRTERNPSPGLTVGGRILVPTDLTPIADGTFEFALDLARRLEARIEVLTVVGHVQGDVYSPIRYSPEASAEHRTARDLLRKDLEALVARHDTSGVRVEKALHRGQPVPTIVSHARQFDADLLVVGTHERGFLHQFLIRSTTEELVRKAPCSILVIHEQDAERPTSVERVLAPLDLSEFSENLLRYAAATARLYGARLDVVHVVEPIPLLDVFAGAMTLRDMVPDMRRRSEAELHALLLDRVDIRDCRLEVTIREGHAAACVLDLAEKKASDLIVIARHGRSALERFFVGSVAERVVRHAGCPVLVAAVAAKSGRAA